MLILDSTSYANIKTNKFKYLMKYQSKYILSTIIKFYDKMYFINDMFMEIMLVYIFVIFSQNLKLFISEILISTEDSTGVN